MFLPGANGPVVMSYQEIESYCNLTGTTLSPQEVILIRRMSQVFIDKHHEGSDPGAPCPSRVESDPEDLEDRIMKSFTIRAARNKRQ